MRFVSIKLAYSDKRAYLVTLFASLLIGYIMYYYTHFEVIAGNMGRLYAYVLVVTQLLLAILFGINVALLWSKITAASLKESGTTTLASLLGILVSGCPACGITLSAYLGLSAVFTSLPFYGLELKVLGIVLLLYSTNSLTKKIACDI